MASLLWPTYPPNHPTQNHKVTTLFACGKLGETPSTQKIAKKLLKWYVWTSLTFLSVQRKMGVLRWRQDSCIWAAHLQNWNLSTSWAGRWVGGWISHIHHVCQTLVSGPTRLSFWYLFWSCSYHPDISENSNMCQTLEQVMALSTGLNLWCTKSESMMQHVWTPKSSDYTCNKSGFAISICSLTKVQIYEAAMS